MLFRTILLRSSCDPRDCFKSFLVIQLPPRNSPHLPQDPLFVSYKPFREHKLLCRSSLLSRQYILIVVFIDGNEGIVEGMEPPEGNDEYEQTPAPSILTNGVSEPFPEELDSDVSIDPGYDLGSSFCVKVGVLKVGLTVCE